MTGLTAACLNVSFRVETPLQTGVYKGAALRGALLDALRRHYCLVPVDSNSAEHITMCPVCEWIAGEDPDRQRGQALPRPYIINPPLEDRTDYQPGDPFTFGLGIFDPTSGMYPYLLSALTQMGAEGLGQRLRENRGQRGRLMLEGIQAYQPFTRQRVDLLKDSALPTRPEMLIQHDTIMQEAARRPVDRVTLRFLTPTRLIEKRMLLKEPQFRPLFQRLMERIIELWRNYAPGEAPLDPSTLLEQAEQVQLLGHDCCWVDLSSTSSRTGKRVPIGGFVGEATYEGTLDALMPWLLWGQVTHVGKNAVKGDGWYEVLV